MNTQKGRKTTYQDIKWNSKDIPDMMQKVMELCQDNVVLDLPTVPITPSREVPNEDELIAAKISRYF